MKKNVHHSKPISTHSAKAESTSEVTTKGCKHSKVCKVFALIAGVLILCGFVGAKYGLAYFEKQKINNFKNTLIPEAVKKVANNAAIKINYVKDTGGIYEFELELGAGTDAKKYVSYITRDGKLLFTSGIKLAELNKPANAAAGAAAGTAPTTINCKDMTKTDKPKLSAYIVSDCPFGLQMQRVYKKAIAELPEIAENLDIRYIGSVENGKVTSMHGDKEAQENLRQICLREEQKNKYWDYVSCYMKEGKSEDCLTSTAVNTANLKSCMAASDRGIAFAKKDFDLSNKYSIGSSPTMLLNETQIVSENEFGGRVPNSLKEIVCCSAKEKPAFCSNSLSKDAVATSFSLDDKAAAAAGGQPAANCGTN